MAERIAASRLATQAGAGYVSQPANAAGRAARALAYLIDSIVLFGFTMLFATASFLNIFLRSDSGQVNASDAAIWTSVAILMLTVPGWFLFNLLLGVRRSQTVGQYVIGLCAVKDDEARPGAARLALYWLALHPLLFHPLLAVFWLLFAYVSISLAADEIVFLAACAIALLCVLAPVAGVLFSLGDRRHRMIHDRVAGLTVVRLE
jgi:uncharacterized RDD family membrane protein YckC